MIIQFWIAGAATGERITRHHQAKILQDKPDNDLSAAIAGLNQKHARVIGGKARVLNFKIDPEKGWRIHDFSSPADASFLLYKSAD